MDVGNQHVLGPIAGNGTTILQTTMNGLSSLLLLCAFAIQSILGRPEGSRALGREDDLLRESVDAFVATERPIALRNLLCNIGPDGCYSAGVSSGIVIASPEKVDPDCQWQGF